jgi:hypothetical protein
VDNIRLETLDDSAQLNDGNRVRERWLVPLHTIVPVDPGDKRPNLTHAVDHYTGDRFPTRYTGLPCGHDFKFNPSAH